MQRTLVVLSVGVVLSIIVTSLIFLLEPTSGSPTASTAAPSNTAPEVTDPARPMNADDDALILDTPRSVVPRAAQRGDCPTDVRQCPDGSVVSRVAPDCTFTPCANGTSTPLNLYAN